MALENIEDNQTKTADDTTHGLLLDSALEGAKAAFMEAKHGGSRVDQPGRPELPGEITFPNPNNQPHQRPHSTLNVNPGTVRA